MQKILPINESPSIKSYVQHSYTNAILQNDKLMEIYIEDFQMNYWDVTPNDINWSWDKKTNTITMLDGENRESTTLHMTRMCKKNDETIVRVQDVKIADPLAYVKIAVDDCVVPKDDELEPFYVKWNQYDININEQLFNHENHKYSYYRVSLQEGRIVVSLSPDEKHWEVIHEVVCDKDVCYFHIYMYFGKNIYNAWKCMNYIQLFYNEKDNNGVYLDYYMFPRKGWDASYNCMCQFLDTEYLDISHPIEVYKGLINYLISCIDEGYYLNIVLDEYYVEGRSAYEKFHYTHYNLVYGYDDVKREIYVFGYTGDGALSSTCILFDVMEKALAASDMVRYKYLVNSYVYDFNIQYVKQAITEYVYGMDSSLKFANILSQREGAYGIKIFDKLMGPGKGLLLNDRLIAYVLYEHCRIMQERLTYMIKHEYVTKDATEPLLEKCNDMLKSSEILKNLVLKNQLVHNCEDNIMKQLGRLYYEQKEFYTCLLEHIVVS